MPLDAIVIGAGIFGSLITRALHRSGMEVLAVDARLPEAGSPPAACLMRPSWFTSLGKDVFEPSLKRLDELVGVQELTFRVNSMTHATVHWCDPKRVLLDENEVRTARVSRIEQVRKGWFVAFQEIGQMPVIARYLIVATGVWTPLLLPEVQVIGQAGVAWLWPKERIGEPEVKAWAPYKQLVAFNRGDGLWVGDGTSVRRLDGAHRMTSRIRCQRFINSRKVHPRAAPIELLGYRPYVKDAKPCFFKQVKPGLWVATGGAKNGTIAAGWCADQIVRAVT